MIIFVLFSTCKNKLTGINSFNKFEKDIPTPVSNKISLAGSSDPDIVRFLKVQNAVSPSLSPDGKWVAYLTRITGDYQIWVTETNRLSAPQQITFGNSVVHHLWSPNGNEIMYGTDKEGDQKVGYYMISRDGTRERELLPSSDAYRFFGDYNKSGSKFIYSTTERNGTDFDIHIYDIENQTDKKLYLGKLGYVPVAFSPDEENIIISEDIGEDANNLFLLNIADSALIQINEPGDLSYFGKIQWKSDGSGFYLITNVGQEFNGIAFYTLEDKSLDYILLREFDIEQLLLSVNEKYLHFVSNEEGYSKHHILDLRTNKEIKAPAWPRGVYRLYQSEDGTTIAAEVYSTSIPGDIWVWHTESTEVIRVTRSTNAGLNLANMNHPEPHSFKARDGLKIHGLLYSPKELGKTTPLVISVHGGPTDQARPIFDALTQYLVEKGFAVFDLNYRGSTGYGKKFARENNFRKRENELYDLEDAVDYLISKNIGNPEKTAVMGTSYGGYLTMAAMTRLPEVFSCGVAFVGVSNWITALEGAAPSLKASDRLEYGNIDDPDDRAFFESISPINYIDQVKSPVMVLHGVNDPQDPVTESDRFVEGIRNNGGEVEYLRFPDEGHGIRKMDNRITAYVRVAEFLEKNLNKSP